MKKVDAFINGEQQKSGSAHFHVFEIFGQTENTCKFESLLLAHVSRSLPQACIQFAAFPINSIDRKVSFWFVLLDCTTK